MKRKSSSFKQEKKNVIANTLFVFGILIVIVGIIIGFLLNKPLGTIGVVIAIISAVFLGLMLIGVSEIIDLLEKIKNKNS